MYVERLKGLPLSPPINLCASYFLRAYILRAFILIQFLSSKEVFLILAEEKIMVPWKYQRKIKV